MIEDDMYRSSSQYRYWSYTQQNLDELRQTTNNLAADRVKAAFQRARSSTAANGESSTDRASEQPTIDTLTVEEELKIVRWGCSKIVEMGEAMTPKIPMSIVATAIQYLRRFYLTNSPMTYHPTQILPCALFLATKSDHWHISLHRFVSQLDSISEDDVKAPEFLLMQGLRFTLDVRHPMRGLDGGVGEMLALVRDRTLRLPSSKDGEEIDLKAAEKRIGAAADKAKTLLQTAAQMTDAYFLYTPPQIWLGALHAADPDLATAYLETKLRSISSSTVPHPPSNNPPSHTTILTTLTSTSALLTSYIAPSTSPSERKELRRIGKKLHVSQNPEKLDIVAVARAKAAEKREGVVGGEGNAEGEDGERGESKKMAKKRKLEGEMERDRDVFGGGFGPSLGREKG